MNPYDYLVSKLAQVEVALEDFEAVADGTPQDREALAKLRSINDQLVRALDALERDGDTIAPHHRSR